MELCRIMTQSHLLRHLFYFELNGTKEHFSLGLNEEKKKRDWRPNKINSICRKYPETTRYENPLSVTNYTMLAQKKKQKKKRKNWAKMRRFVLFFLEWIYKKNICMHLFNGDKMLFAFHFSCSHSVVDSRQFCEKFFFFFIVFAICYSAIYDALTYNMGITTNTTSSLTNDHVSTAAITDTNITRNQIMIISPYFHIHALSNTNKLRSQFHVMEKFACSTFVIILMALLNPQS